MREMLLGAAGEGLFRPHWSPRVLEEWARAVERDGGSVRGEIAAIETEWPGASVEPRAGDLGRLHLPDENDIHVLAAAIACGADLLITLNAKDFPRHALGAEGLSRQDPDGFLRALWGEDAGAIARVAGAVQARAFAAGVPETGMRALMKRARLPRLGKALG